MKDYLLRFFSKFAHKWPFPTEGKKYYFILVIFLLASFLFSLIRFFPVNALKGSVERELARRLNSDIAIGSLALEFPLDIRANNVRATLSTPIPYVLRFDSLLLNPAWSTFFGGGSSYVFSGNLNGGHLEGEADEEGNLVLDLHDVRFSFPFDTKGSRVLAGVAREGHFSGKYPPGRKDETELVLNVDNLELRGAKTLGLKENILPLGQLRLRSKGQGRALQVEQLTLSGGAVGGDASGTVMLRTPLDLSTLRLRGVLRTDPGSKVANMFSLLKKPDVDGSFHIRLLGTFRQPIVR